MDREYIRNRKVRGSSCAMLGRLEPQNVVAALRELLEPPEPCGAPMAVAGSNAAFLGVEPAE